MRVNSPEYLLKTFKEGQPQGSVYFPFSFTIFMEDLLVDFENNIFVSAYADCLWMARSARNKDMIVASFQPEVDKVVAMSY